MRPGWKTSEFYFTALAMLVGLLISSGIWGPEDPVYKALAFVGSTLTALGYSVSRGMAKKGGGQ